MLGTPDIHSATCMESCGNCLGTHVRHHSGNLTMSRASNSVANHVGNHVGNPLGNLVGTM